MLIAGSCPAENLPDPTRPPALLGPLPPGFGEEVDNTPAPMPVLQSIILSATRKAAIISGQTVVLGEKFGDARLVRLTESEAVLRMGDGLLQVLKLFPDVDKKERLVPQDEDMNGKGKRSAVPGKKARQ
jgi:MSHA biogenesis protein MshK